MTWERREHKLINQVFNDWVTASKTFDNDLTNKQQLNYKRVEMVKYVP